MERLLGMLNEIEYGQVEISKENRNAEVEEFNRFILEVGEAAKTAGRLGIQRMENFFDGSSPKDNAIAAMSNKDIYESFIPVVVGQMKVGIASANQFMSFDAAIISSFMDSKECKVYWELLNSRKESK